MGQKSNWKQISKRKMKLIFTFFLSTFLMINIFGQKKLDKEFNKVADKIYPVIKIQTFETDDNNVIKMTGEDEPIFTKLTGDLLCFYGIDRGSNFELLLKRNLPESVTIEKLDSLATANLRKEIEGNLKIHQTDFGGFGFTCGGNYEAALFKLSGIWELMTESLGESIIFIVPSKDLIMFVKSEDQNGIDGLKKIIEEVHNGGDRLLSKHLFKYENGRMDLYE